MDWVFLFIIAAFFILASASILTVVAKRQLDVRLLGGTADGVLAHLERSGCFNKGWKRTSGEGSVNLKLGFSRGGRDGRPVLSIKVEDVADGAHVTVWMSRWKIVALRTMEPMPAVAVILRRARISKALDAISEAVPPRPQEDASHQQ